VEKLKQLGTNPACQNSIYEAMYGRLN